MLSEKTIFFFYKVFKLLIISHLQSKQEDSGVAELGMDNLGGVYFVLAVGSVFATFYGLLEWLYHIFKRARRNRVSFMKKLKDEYKVITSFSTATRPSDDMISVYSSNS